MKKNFRFMGAALCVLAIAACEKSGSDKGGSITGSSSKQYVVASGSGEAGAYLQSIDDPTQGILDPAVEDGRIYFDGNNPDFLNYNNEILVGMNYPSQGGSTSDYITKAWKLVDGKLTQHGSGVALDGDVKARGFFNNYLIGMSDQASDNNHYERVKFIDVETFGAAVVDGIIDCDAEGKEPQSLMDGETWGVGDIAQYGDYVLLSYSTKHLVKDGGSVVTKAKASYSTDLANNLYLGVYKFDPTDSEKEYLKYQNAIIRKSSDHPGEEAGQIKGNLRSRTETGIEVIGDEIYLFCQGSKNSGKDYPDVPSAVLRISGDNIKDGKPVGIDDDYYVNLTEVTGHYMWKCFYLGDNKFCLQLYTQEGTAGFMEGSHKAFGIFDVKTKAYTAVTGMPTDIINDIALAYAVDTDSNTITFEVETTDSQLPALYTISKDGKAVRGTEVDTEAIKGVSLLIEK